MRLASPRPDGRQSKCVVEVQTSLLTDAIASDLDNILDEYDATVATGVIPIVLRIRRYKRAQETSVR